MNPKSAATLLFILGSVPCGAVTIVLNAATGMDAQAVAGFRRAADYWQEHLADGVTVNLDIGFTSLGTGILGSTSATRITPTVGSVMSALAADATSAADQTAAAHLPPLSGGEFLSFLTQKNTEGGSTVVSLDNDSNALNSSSNNNGYLMITTANAKALGWIPEDPLAADGSITFSSSFGWDFDQTDGIGAGLQDFVGVAIHEIGHSLGFMSGVDLVDYYIRNPLNLDPYAIFSTLDLYRYSAPGTLNFATGAAAYFSIDGGTTSLGAFSTGVYYGDGRQASHWKDNQNLGLMDPTANPAGQANTPSDLDLLAFDVIGWDMPQASAVPETSSCISLAALLGAGMCFRRRR